MNVLNDWTCKVTLEKEVEITVGQPFAITCEGGTPINVDSEILIFPNNDKVKYDIIALDKKARTENQIFVKATSWKTGKKTLKDHTIVIGDQIIEIKGPDFNVKSVLESGSEMNLPPGVSVEPLPAAAKLSAGILFIILIAGVFYWFRTNRKYDRALIKLHSMKTSLSPYNELHKQLRRLDVELSKVEESASSDVSIVMWIQRLDEVVTQYLSLSTSEPLFIYKPSKRKKVVKKFLKKKRMSDEIFSSYLAMINEIESLNVEIKNNSPSLIKDLASTMDMVRDFADSVLAAEAGRV